MSRNPFLVAALTAAARGWCVFPLVRGGKTPGLREWEQWATTDRWQICRWWANCAVSNFGVATGRSGLVVIGLDEGCGQTPPAEFAGARDGCEALAMLVAAAGAEIPTDPSSHAAQGRARPETACRWRGAGRRRRSCGAAGCGGWACRRRWLHGRRGAPDDQRWSRLWPATAAAVLPVGAVLVAQFPGGKPCSLAWPAGGGVHVGPTFCSRIIRRRPVRAAVRSASSSPMRARRAALSLLSCWLCSASCWLRRVSSST